MPVVPSFREWLRKITWQIAFAVVLAATLALTTDASVTMSLRYLAGTSGLFALGQVIAAFARQRDVRARFSEWDSAIALVAISEGAQFLAHWIG